MIGRVARMGVGRISCDWQSYRPFRRCASNGDEFGYGVQSVFYAPDIPALEERVVTAAHRRQA